ncbi:Gfo/Idh/MocA family oxidoreductase [Candidatus Bathyarchaeota archaeon]|nr:Gfo/Idh/MocA family oxidoreductase [Candidatus Bathyarchaeota archaeon]
MPSHFQIIKSVYADGVADNVFVEKTLASTYDQCVELSQLALDRKSVNMVGYMNRFSVTFGKAKELLNQRIGEPVSFDSSAYSSDFFDVKEGVMSSASRGGVLRDLGSHVIDLALWYFGDMKVNSAVLKPLFQRDHENSAELRVETASGSTGKFDVSWCRNDYRMPEFVISVKGTQGSLMVSNDELRLEMNNGESSVWYRQDLDDSVGFLLGGPEYFREDEHFLKSIMSSCDASPDFRTSSKVDFLIDEAEKVAGKDG